MTTDARELRESRELREARDWQVVPGETHWVSLRYFCSTRLAVACLLLGAAAVMGDRMTLGEAAPQLFLRVVFAYVPLSAAFLAFAILQPSKFYLQLAAQLLLDLTVLTLLMYTSGGPRSGLAALFLLPVAGAAILSPAPLALLFAAISSLAILGESVWREISFDVGTGSFVQAGLYGASSFAIALVMNRLAARLISQERIAEQRGQDLQSQIEINRAVVADMQDGVLILSHAGQPRSLNPAAARMLHIDEPAALVAAGWGDHGAGTAISSHFLAWRDAMTSQPDVVEIVLATPAETRADATAVQAPRLRARFVMPPVEHPEDGDYLVFLEDLQRVEERAQQLKLASMGRLTASIAHEIRNPLAAISHAAALMAEDSADGTPQERMLRIVQDNAKRLNRIVENILQLSRRATVEMESIDLTAYLRNVAAEFCGEQGVAAELVDISLYGAPVIMFNADHLRQVLVNLLQNAQRYASGEPGSISLTVVPVSAGTGSHGAPASHAERIELIVQDDGPGIGPQALPHLFEPFFTTHYRGTGLGLYLARELCMANGATLNYVPNTEESKHGGFVVNASGIQH